ncbi:hypothetical protein E2320_005289 [Naja naja]|nr:hypothetical protein E2320_005289 [Naja naja]
MWLQMIEDASFRKLINNSECPEKLKYDFNKNVPKRNSSNLKEHTTYVWDHFISKTSSRNVAFIAHGYEVLIFINLLMQRTLEVMNKVYAVVLIDSKHHMKHQTQGNSEVQTWIWKHCQEWVLNSKPIDKSVGYLGKTDCPIVSTRSEKYNMAPSSSLQSIFKYLKNALKVLLLWNSLSTELNTFLLLATLEDSKSMAFQVAFGD